VVLALLVFAAACGSERTFGPTSRISVVALDEPRHVSGPLEFRPRLAFSESTFRVDVWIRNTMARDTVLLYGGCAVGVRIYDAPGQVLLWSSIGGLPCVSALYWSTIRAGDSISLGVSISPYDPPVALSPGSYRIKAELAGFGGGELSLATLRLR
jgi:hypothetical protein